MGLHSRLRRTGRRLRETGIFVFSVVRRNISVAPNRVWTASVIWESPADLLQGARIRGRDRLRAPNRHRCDPPPRVGSRTDARLGQVVIALGLAWVLILVCLVHRQLPDTVWYAWRGGIILSGSGSPQSPVADNRDSRHRGSGGSSSAFRRRPRPRMAAVRSAQSSPFSCCQSRSPMSDDGEGGRRARRAVPAPHRAGRLAPGSSLRAGGRDPPACHALLMGHGNFARRDQQSDPLI